MTDTQTHDDIAVIGLACRFPGDASSSQRFFDMLCHGRSAWSEVPADRFNIDAYWHPSYDHQGTVVAKSGYFLKENIAKWDAPFFSMTAAEANALDPQQRILLEVAYESMENAGLPINELVGSDTGCYVGAFTKDYEQICTRDLGDKLLYTGTGNGPTMLANRVSWFYDFRGASVSLDTACSSSLVSVHLACEDIRSTRTKTRLALAGGVSLILAPDMGTSLSALHFLSPDGRSYSFDARANGYARGEGCSFLVLKHIDDAIRDGDTIRAVIRGTAVNQDGKTPGISLPSSESQAALIRSTYNAAGLPYSDTGFFEAHGTGTAAGDPLEASSIGATFGKDKDRSEPLWVGSLKSNVGHLEGTAGVAGLVKSILSVESGLIFPQCDFRVPNPKIRMQEWGIRFPTKVIPWPSGKLRRVSVNSFGYGGTNAHAIVDDAYYYLNHRGLIANHSTVLSDTSPAASDDSALGSMSSSASTDGYEYSPASALTLRPRLFALSSPEQVALSRMADQYGVYLQGKNKKSVLHGDEVLSDLAYTLAVRRSTFQWRAAVVASTAAELAASLDEAAKKPLRSSKPPRTVWIFNGQGAQWARMGVELMEYKAFSASVSAADSYLKSLGADWSVINEMLASEDVSRINSPRLSQPLCAVLQVATVDLLRHWGLQPQVVIGHSSGEIGAAYAFGAISAEDAWKIAYHRGRLSQEIKTRVPSQHGAMMSVGLSEDEVRSYLAKPPHSESDVVVACINSPTNVTLSGSHHALLGLEKIFQAENIFARLLKVENAYHSPHMQIIAQDYFQALSDIVTSPVTDDIKMFSSVTGAPVKSSDLSGQYWVQNMVQPVQFVQALDQTFDTAPGERRKRRSALRIDCAIEIGPHGALRGPLFQFLTSRKKKESTSYYSILARGKDAVRTALKTMGSLWSLGAKIDLTKVNDLGPQPLRGKVLLDLPSYPWNHTNSYWHESSQSKNHRFRTTARLEYLGAPVEDFNPLAPLWKNILRKSEVPWLADHKVQQDIVFPGAGMICAALEAARQIADTSQEVKAVVFRDIAIGRALVIPEDDIGIEIFMHIKPRKFGMKGSPSLWNEFTFYSLDRSGTHHEHSSGLFQILYENDTNGSEKTTSDEAQTYRAEYDMALEECTKTIDRDELYSIMQVAGLNYGPTFKGMTTIRAGDMVACTEVTIPDTKATMPSQYETDHLLHPATLDAFFQSSVAAFLQTGDLKDAMIPTSIGHLWISAKPPRGAGKCFEGMIRSAKRGFREMSASITMTDPENGEPAVIIKDYVVTSVGSQNAVSRSLDATEALRSKVCSKVIYRPDVNLLGEAQAQELLGLDIDDSNLLRRWNHDSSKATVLWTRRLLDSLGQQSRDNLGDNERRLYDLMQHQYQLAEKGNLPHQYRNTAWLCLSEEAEDEFLGSFCQTYETEGELMRKMFENTADVLNGTKPAMDDWSDDISPVSLYASKIWQIGHKLVSNWFDLAGHKNPDMKVLEVNAGDASVSLPILQTLGGQSGSTARFASYTFTNDSHSSFETSQAILNEWSGLIEYKKLNITKELSSSDVELESMDVIVLNNLSQKPDDPMIAIENCVKLLKPAGKLIVIGSSQSNDFISSVHNELANQCQMLNHQASDMTSDTVEWNETLNQAGLSQIWSIHETSNQVSQSISMIVSERPVSQQEAHLTIHVLRNPSSDKQRSIARIISQQLIAQGHSVIEMSLDETVSNESLPPSENCFVSLLEIDQILLADIDSKDFDAFKAIVLSASRMLWVTCTSLDQAAIDPHLRTVSGLFRGISADNESVRLHELHLHHRLIDDETGASTLIMKSLISALSAEDGLGESDMIEQDGRLCIPRLYEESNSNHRLSSIGKNPTPELQPLLQHTRPLKLTIGSPGMLDTLHFVDDSVQSEPLPVDYVEVEIKANALNFVDVMVAMGQVPDTAIGMDAAGVVINVGSKVSCLQVGDRVAFAKVGAFATVLRVSAQLPQKLPDNVSFEEGSTIPVIWTTAYYSLLHVARLSRGETILIHSAAGGLGLALIQLAHYIGAEVYATVGTRAKRELIMSMGVAEDHIFNSRDLSFAPGILCMTHGKGVDVVVNNLAGEALRKTWECVTEFGRFIEVGKRDILENTGLEMRPFLKNVTFAGVNIERMLRNYQPRWVSLFQEVMGLFHSGVARAVQPMTVYDWSDMETCFRTMQQGRHIGKLVMRMTSDSKVLVIPRNPHPLELRSDAAYVLVGGLGGLGRGQAIRLAERGARHIAFISRSGAAKPNAIETLQQLQSMGVKAVAYQCDVTNKGSLSQILTRITEELAPIRGVVQGAMVLADGLFENMSHEKWLAATRPKIQGTWNLHELMPKDLDFFVILSSVVGVTGGRTQPNYAAGNSFQDALSDYRRSLGLPVQVVDLGVITGLGYIEENKDNAELAWVTAMEMLTIKPTQFYAMFESALTGYSHGEHKLPPQIIMGAGGGGLDAANQAAGSPYQIPWLERFARFAYLKKLDLRGVTGANDDDPANNIKAQLANANSATQAAEFVQNAITMKLAKSMMISAADIDPTKPLHHYGIDSLVAVEVRNWIIRELKSDVSIFDILASTPISQLAAKIAVKSKLVSAEIRGEGEVV